MAKGDFRKQKEERSPFEVKQVVVPEEVPLTLVPPEGGPTQEEVPAKKRAKRASKEQPEEERYPKMDEMAERIKDRKLLTNFAFRYKEDELKGLNTIYETLHNLKPGRVSKNDLARMGQLFLQEDYNAHGDDSLIMRIFKLL